MKTRRPLAILTATAITGLSLTALATPASANTTVTIGGTWAEDGEGFFQPADADDSGFVGPDLEGTTITGSAVTIAVDPEAVFGDVGDGKWTVVVMSESLTLAGESCSLGCGITHGTSVQFSISPAANESFVTAYAVVGDSEPEQVYIFNDTQLFRVSYQDAPAPAPVPAAPAVVDVTLDQITSEVLRTWASTATLGSWKQLPESSDITGVGENAGKTFLGAATTPNFPVDIAQRQVDNGWGAYETFNEDGDLTSVFIPAGGWMAITNSTRLYAIWGD